MCRERDAYQTAKWAVYLINNSKNVVVGDVVYFYLLSAGRLNIGVSYFSAVQKNLCGCKVFNVIISPINLIRIAGKIILNAVGGSSFYIVFKTGRQTHGIIGRGAKSRLDYVVYQEKGFCSDGSI